MKKQELKVSFNAEWAKSVTREKFIKNHEKAYPNLNLGEVYDDIVSKKKKDPVADKSAADEKKD